MTVDDRPLVLVRGNCQNHFLAAVLVAAGTAEVVVLGRRFAFDPALGGARPGYADAAEGRAMQVRALAAGRQVLLLGQATPRRVAAIRPAARSHDRLRALILPHLECYAPWPGQRGQEDADPRRLRRLLAYDIAAMRSSAGRADLGAEAVEAVIADLPRQPAFLSWNHPSAAAQSGIAATLFGAIPDLVPPEAAQRVLGILARHTGVGRRLMHPLPIARLDALGFDWGPAYRAWAEAKALAAQGHHAAARPLLVDAAEGLPLMWKARLDLAAACFALGDRAAGWAEVARATSFCAWLGWADVPLITRWVLAREASPAMLDAAVAAAGLHPGQAQLDLMVARALATAGRGAAALDHALRAMEAAPARHPVQALVARLAARHASLDACRGLLRALADRPDAAPAAIALLRRRIGTEPREPVA